MPLRALRFLYQEGTWAPGELDLGVSGIRTGISQLCLRPVVVFKGNGASSCSMERQKNSLPS